MNGLIFSGPSKAAPKRKASPLRIGAGVLFLGIGWAAPITLAQTPQLIVAAKYLSYRQNSATGVDPTGGGVGVQVAFPVSVGASATVQLRHPSGTTTPLMREPDGSFSFEQAFDSVAALNSAFPDGSYSVVLSGGVAPATVFALAGPEAPPSRIENFDALQAWPNERAEILWRAIEGARRDDFLEVKVEREGGVAFETTGSFDPRSTSVLTDTLRFGLPYAGSLSYLRLTSSNTNGGGTQVIVGRGFTLEFALLLVIPRPVIVEQPDSLISRRGDSARFRIVTRNPQPPAYQWRKDGTAIPGATRFEFLVPVVRLEDAGTYSVEVRGQGGAVVSDSAELLISPSLRPAILSGGLQQAGSADGPGASARFSSPGAIVLDAAGNLYLSDRANHTIRRIGIDGNVSTLAGSARNSGAVDGTGAAARFFNPAGLAIDPAGNLVVADSGNHTLRRITPAGVVTTLAGAAGQAGLQNGVGAAARFNSPLHVAVGRDGTVFVTESDVTAVRRVSPAGMVATHAGAVGLRGFIDGPAASARFNFLGAMAVDATGALLVIDQLGAAIRTISTGGDVGTLLVAGWESPRITGLVPASDGYLYLSDAFAGVARISAAGARSWLTAPRLYGEGPGTPFYDRFLPVGLARDAAGMIYASDTSNHTIVRGLVEPGTADPKISFSGAPLAHALALGESVALTTAALGPYLSYQWRRNGSLIAGATDRSLLVRRGSAESSGRYAATVWNNVGEAISPAIDLSFGPTNNVGRLSNLSVRSRAAAGAQTLIVGMAVGGAAAAGGKPLLIRGIGPALGGFGLEGVLVDPTLSVYRGAQVLATNDDWGGTATLRDGFSAVGAFSLPAASRDAALGQSFSPGAYTVQIAGNGGATGVALAEIYDAAPGAMAPGAARLINLSARTQVGTDAETLIAGFVIGGATSKTVLIRAIGPGLAPFGVAGVLADPRVQLYRGSERIAANDSWRDGGPALSTAFETVGAFPIQNADAALLITLAPGNYSVQVSGREGGTGIALVEVYELP